MIKLLLLFFIQFPLSLQENLEDATSYFSSKDITGLNKICIDPEERGNNYREVEDLCIYYTFDCGNKRVWDSKKYIQKDSICGEN